MNNLKHQCHRPAFQSFSFKVDAQLLLLPPLPEKKNVFAEAETSPEGSPPRFFMFSLSFIFTSLRQRTERAENGKKLRKITNGCISSCSVFLFINHRKTVAADRHFSHRIHRGQKSCGAVFLSGVTWRASEAKH